VGGHDDLLKSNAALRIFGSADDAARIPGITDRLRDGETIRPAGLPARVILIPAHTSGHVAYHFPDEKAVFTGDTLFIAGCGRLFEGDAAQMMRSLGKLSALPDDTAVYCGHEYTEKNLRFAATLEPGNARLRENSPGSRRSAGRERRPSRARSPRRRRRTPSSEPAVRSWPPRCAGWCRICPREIRSPSLPPSAVSRITTRRMTRDCDLRAPGARPSGASWLKRLHAAFAAWRRGTGSPL
jgi:glyoxylase-like metal-dependent hydrolase (beta-lactamase superfamily II)